MTTDDRTMTGFRRRLHELIADQCEGKYTWLAQRAGIPVSSLQYCLHHARHFPGGDQLLRLADVLGVSVDYLLTGRE
jgi:hypothetical protein